MSCHREERSDVANQQHVMNKHFAHSNRQLDCRASLAMTNTYREDRNNNAVIARNEAPMSRHREERSDVANQQHVMNKHFAHSSCQLDCRASLAMTNTYCEERNNNAVIARSDAPMSRHREERSDVAIQRHAMQGGLSV